MRSKADVCEVAYVGALEQTIPSFIGQKGICPQLSHLVGDLGDVASRWQPLIQSGCRTGKELHDVWSSITTEMSESAAFLAEELDDMFILPVEAVGDGRTDGSTRGLLTEKRETVRARVLKKALENFPDQTARPVLSLPQLDKLSTAWWQALPGPFSGLTSPVFSEAMCTHLCLPSPACSDRLGETIGRGDIVDVFGDRVNTATLPGDTWRH